VSIVHFVYFHFVACFLVNLMGLLKWRDNPKGLETYLRLFMKVDGEEIVKVGNLSVLLLAIGNCENRNLIWELYR